MAYLLFLVLWVAINFVMLAYRRSDKIILIVNGLLLVTIAGLRGINIGTDVRHYGLLFVSNGSLSYWEILTKTSDSMLGYRLLSKTVYVLANGNYQIMLIVSAVIITYCILKFVYRYSPNVTASVFYYVTIFYYFETFNGVRQWLAVSIILLGLIAYDEHRYIKFLVLTIISISVHNSAVITLIPYLCLNRINWNKILFIIFTIIVFAAMSLFPYLIRFFMYLFPRYSTYTILLEEGFVGQGFGGEAHGRRIVYSIAFLAVIAFAMMLLPEKTLLPDCGFRKKPEMRNVFWISAAMTMIEIVIGITFYNNTFYMRIQSFFSFFSIIMLPTVFERVEKRWRPIIYIGSNMLFLIASGIRLVQSTGGHMYPYQFFWQ